MSITEAQILAAVSGLDDVLSRLSSDDQNTVMEALKKSIPPAVWFQEHGLTIARANIAAMKTGNAVRVLQALTGSKLDMEAMIAINDTTTSDEQRVEALIRALYSLLGEHQLIMAAASQLLTEATAFEAESKQATDAVLAFNQLPKDN